MWTMLWTVARLPLVGSCFGLVTLIVIDRLILPLHHAAATTDGILFIECVVLVVLLGGLVWDKSQIIRHSVRAKRSKHHELFTWNEIGKVLACLATSMLIFVAVVKVLDLKAANQHRIHLDPHAAPPK